MTLNFEKYHGCGNDFIIIDNSKGQIDRSILTVEVIKSLCDRRYGIGADGLMVVESSDNSDFHMFYANSDGRESTMCGNGGRCIVAFAYSHQLIKRECNFEAIDGMHTATLLENGHVRLGMNSVSQIEQDGDGYVLDSGSPHYVTFVNDLENFDVLSEGKSIRYSNQYQEDGINVNFLEIKEGKNRIRTYERGVEAETEACGTGVTAAAIILSKYYDQGQEIKLETNGGLLTVRVGRISESKISDISLSGPAVLVYKGIFEIPA